MRTPLLLLASLVLSLALIPTATAGGPCTTPPKQPVEQVVWAATCAIERAPVEEIVPTADVGEVDLRWLNNCPGPWGHEERTTVGPVTIVTYECDDGGA